MKISTTTELPFAAFGFQKGIQFLKEVGFDAMDLSLFNDIYTEPFSEENYEETCQLLNRYAKDAGIYFNQAHAPFPSYRFGDDAYNEKVRPALLRSIKIAGLVGANQIIVHPTPTPEGVDQKQFNIDFYNELQPLCEEYGVKIALENMWGYSAELERIVPNVCSLGRDLASYYDALDPNYFTVCLDLGHCGLVGQNAAAAIYELGGSRLHALHVHDNDDIHDLHIAPFQGNMDWNAIMTALKSIEYDGDLTFEVISKSSLGGYKSEPELLLKAYELLFATGKNLVHKYDTCFE